MIKKFILTVFVFSIFITGFTQRDISKTTIDGKEYFVYPYRFEKLRHDRKVDYFYSDFGNEIVPYPGKLPDGDYVMYHATTYFRRRPKRFHKKGYLDSTIVAALFHLVDNKKEGEAMYFNKWSHELIEEGTYKNDERNGFWIYFSFEFIIDDNYYKNPQNKRPKFVKKDIRSGIYPTLRKRTKTICRQFYVNGLKEGPFKEFAEEDSSYVFMTGQYSKNKPSGEWKSYYGNGNLHTSLRYAKELDYDSEKRPYEKLGKYSRTLLFPVYDEYDGWHYVFHESGQLYFRNYYKNGISEGLDTVYYEDGSVQRIFYKNEIESGDSVLTIIEHKEYTYNHQLDFHEQWINSDRSFHKNYRDGILSHETYYEPYFYHLKGKDTVVMTSARYSIDKNDSVKLYSKEYLHILTGTKLKREFRNNGSCSDDFIFQKIPNTNNFSLILIDGRGKRNEFEIRTFKQLILKDSLKGYNIIFDSTRIFSKDKIFSGEFVLHRGSSLSFGRGGKVELKGNRIIYWTENGGETHKHGLPFIEPTLSNKLLTRTNFNLPSGIFGLEFTSYINYTNGTLDGPMKIYNKRHGRLLVSRNFKNGKLDGEQMEYDGERTEKESDCREVVDNNISKKFRFNNWKYFLISKTNYSEGVLNGVICNYHCNGRVNYKIEYISGKPHGKYEHFDERGVMRELSYYDNGLPDGEYRTWYPNKKPIYEFKYDHGYIEGEYKYYYSDGTVNTQGEMQGGYKVGEWRTNFDEGNVKYLELFSINDSIDYRYYSEDRSNDICYSKQFYPSSSIASEGRIEKGKRQGLWKFYDEGENLIKQINYESGIILQEKNDGTIDSIPHFGYYESWHRNGIKESEGYILNETTKYDCYQEVNISMQDLHYINFWRSDGTQILKEGTGRIETYHLTTAKRESEGEMMNGFRQGYWRFWDPDGKLCRVGNYLNGLENGSWLVGDLDGMHFLDDACFDMSNRKVLEQMEYDKKVLSIFLLYYDKGELLKEVGFNVNLNTINNDPDNWRYKRKRIRIID